MGMAKQYDRSELLDCAVELFRRQGFNGTSTADLVAELGINRKSMYAEFGSKQQLFEAVLAHYNAAPPAPLGLSELMSLSLSDQELRQLER